MTQYESIHQKFLLYLEKNVRTFSVEEREALVHFAETQLVDYIRTYFIPHFGKLYAKTDAALYQDLRNKVNTKPEAKAENEACEGRYSMALKYYAAFLQSAIFKGKEKVKLMAGEAKACQDPLLPVEEAALTEGKLHQVSLTKHERNQALRQLCLKHYGYTCQVCGMNFEAVYGKLGKNYIEVHHINPIAETDGEHVLDPKTGLIPLCSNCHSMIHRGKNGRVLTPEELKAILHQQKSKQK